MCISLCLPGLFICLSNLDMVIFRVLQKGMVMEENYYENIIKKIKNLIEIKEYTAAVEIITAELNQVYIPNEYEDVFHNLYNEAESFLIDFEEDATIMSKQQLIGLLNGSREQQFAAINNLEGLNLRNYLDIISDFFVSDNLAQLKGRLLHLCVGQNIDVNFDFKVNDEIISVNPSVLEAVDDMDFIGFAFDYFNNHLYKNPSLIQISQIALVEKVYSIYPRVFLKDNVVSICQAIIEEVSEMFDIDSIQMLGEFYN